jgi:hypothetical protein
MKTRTSFLFPPFRLELNSDQLWRDWLDTTDLKEAKALLEELSH